MERTPSPLVSTVRHEDRSLGRKETRSRGSLRSGFSVMTTFRWSDASYRKTSTARRDARTDANAAMPCLRGEG